MHVRVAVRGVPLTSRSFRDCSGRRSLCMPCPTEGCFTRKATDLALKGARPYLEGRCTVCNYVLWKSRSAKDGTTLLDTLLYVGEKRRRRPAKRVAEEELDAALIAGAIASAGTAHAFWRANLWDMRSMDGPAGPYTQRMVYWLRTWKPGFICDVSWKWAAVRGRTPRRLPTLSVRKQCCMRDFLTLRMLFLPSKQQSSSCEKNSLSDVETSLRGFVGEHGYNTVEALMKELTR